MIAGIAGCFLFSAGCKGTGASKEHTREAEALHAAHGGEGEEGVHDEEEADEHDNDGGGHAQEAAAPEEHDHEGEEADAHAEEAGEHAGHGHEGEAADAHADELLVVLTDAGKKLAGITYEHVAPYKVRRTVLLPGEVVFNEERVVHVGPRYAGILREVTGTIGDVVAAGDALAVIENNEHLTTTTLKAPMSGRIIEKHAVRGEFVSPENSIFVIADLSNVWVNCAVTQQQEVSSYKGLKAHVTAPGTSLEADGTISYLSPVVDPETRTITARIVLPNSKGVWRPGVFVDVVVTTESSEAVPAVLSSAVQTMKTDYILFVAENAYSFKPVKVTIGRTDGEFTEITSGIENGAEYIAQGAFELKAQLITKTLGAHAGHGH